MKSIAISKPDMGVLPRERLQLSPFGALALAFAEEMLSRRERTEGAWPFLPLALLEEGERFLREAKAAHDRMEAVYNAHVDFDGVRALAEEEWSRIRAWL